MATARRSVSRYIPRRVNSGGKWRRSASLIAAFALSVGSLASIGVAQVVGASADELATGVPQVADAPSLTASSYTISDATKDSNTMITDAADLRSQINLTPGGSDETTMATGFPLTPTVLAGDNVTLMGAVWSKQGGMSPDGTEPDWSAAGNWVSVPGDWTVTGNINSQDSISYDWTGWPSPSNATCATGTPTVNTIPGSVSYTTVWNAWCMASQPAVWSATIKGVAVPTTPGSFGANMVEFYAGYQDPASPTATYFGGPNDPAVGSNSSTYGRFVVLNPALQVTKLVCKTGTGCDPSVASQWVDSQVIPQGSTSVQWLITAKNTGNVDLGDVTTAEDNWGYTDPADDAGKVTGSTCESLDFGALAAGVSTSKTCTSALSDPLVGTLVNGINLNGTLANPSQYALDPNGNPITDRLTGNPTPTSGGKGVPGVVGSNTAVAQVSMPIPGIKLTKWACSTGTGCDTPSGATLATLAGVGAKHANGTYAVTQGKPAGGWVKQAPVPYASDVDWVVVVSNTGNTYLKDVTPTDTLPDASGGAGASSALSPASVALLAPGDSAVFTASTATVTNTHAFGNVDSGSIDPGTGEPTTLDTNRHDVVNVAQASGTPADSSGTVLKDAGGKELAPIDSNKASAEANTVAPVPGIALTKWVCQKGTSGTGCTVPTTSAGLKSTDALTAAGWVKSATVDYGTQADWLIVVENTGKTALASVSLTEEVTTGDGQGTTNCTTGPVADLLAPGEAVAVRCSSSQITNTNAWGTADQVSSGSAGDVVNTAQAQGTPADSQGNPLPAVDGGKGSMPPVPSNEASAQVRTDMPNPAIGLTKWVCQTGTGCVPPTAQADMTSTAALNAAGWVKATTVDYATPADWLIVVTNTGDTTLASVTLSLEKVTGLGAGVLVQAQTTPTGCVAGAPVADSLAAGASATVLCTSSQITNLQTLTLDKDVINTAEATGTPVGKDGKTPLPKADSDTGTWGDVTSNQDKAEVNTTLPKPGIALTKWVCQAGTCAKPTIGDLVSLGAGTPAGGWVKATTVPYASQADWLIVVTNTGDTYLAGVTLSDTLTGDGAGTLTGCVDGMTVAGLLAPGASVPLMCSSSQITNTNAWGTAEQVSSGSAGDVVNTATTTGTPSDKSGKPLPKPEDAPGTIDNVTSPPDSAQVNTTPLAPGLKATKWVCQTGTDCATPTGDALATLAGYDAATGVVAQGKPAGGWVKQATVAYDTDAAWLVIVTNTGNTYLSGVTLSDAATTVGAGATATPVATDPNAEQLLAPGASVVYTGSTAAITNTNALGKADSGPTDNAFKEPLGMDTGRADVVNVASATGTPTDDQGNPLPNTDGKTGGLPPVASNQASAEVNAIAPKPGLALTKWVCKAGTGCQTPKGAALASLGAGKAAGGWVKATTVRYATQADWLITVTNTGNTVLAPVTLSAESTTGNGRGTLTGCSAGSKVADSLAVGASAAVRCASSKITNASALKSGKDVVNTAQAAGTPVDEHGTPIPKPNGGNGPWDKIVSNPGSAEVNTVVPGPGMGAATGGASVAGSQAAVIVGVFLLALALIVVAYRRRGAQA